MSKKIDVTELILRDAHQSLMATRMAIAGFKKIEFQRFMFGTIAIHWGEKVVKSGG